MSGFGEMEVASNSDEARARSTSLATAADFQDRALRLFCTVAPSHVRSTMTYFGMAVWEEFSTVVGGKNYPEVVAVASAFAENSEDPNDTASRLMSLLRSAVAQAHQATSLPAIALLCVCWNGTNKTATR